MFAKIPARMPTTSNLYRSLCRAAALAPPIHILCIVLTTGENNLSNDYIGWVPLVSAALKGSYDRTAFFKDTLAAGSHPMAVPVLIHLAVARFAHWNMSVELCVGLALFLAAYVLLGLALTRSVQSETRWLLWPLLSLLIFSTAHLANFTFGETSLQVGATVLGLTLGTWGVARFEGRLGTTICMCAGAWLATWSWGGGFLLWPVFGVALAFASRRVVPVLTLGAVGLVAAAPYFRPFLTANRPGAVGDRTMSFVGFVLQLIGRPFLDGTGKYFGPLPYGTLIGLVGITLAAGGVALLLIRGREGIRPALPALMVMGFSLAVILEIAVSRRQIAPWYVFIGSLFWVGLLGLSLVLADRPERSVRSWSRWACLFLIACVGLLGLRVNGSWLDKDFYLASRSPASAACLREGSARPESCEAFLFQWGTGHPELVAQLARPLQELRLSVFEPRQTWLLQGDEMLGRAVFELPPGAEAHWQTRSGTQASFTDPRRLDLVLPAGGQVRWNVTLPKRLRKARFRSEVTLLGGALAGVAELLEPGGTGRILSRVEPGSKTRNTIIDAALDTEAGRTFTICLRAGVPSSPPASSVVFAVPRILLIDDTPAGALHDAGAFSRTHKDSPL